MSVRHDATLYSEVARIERGNFLRFHCEQLSASQRDVQRYFFGAYYPRWHAFYLEEVREIVGNRGVTELRHFPAHPLDAYCREDGATYLTDDFAVDNVIVVGQPQNQRDDDVKRFRIVSVDDTLLRTKTSSGTSRLSAIPRSNKGPSSSSMLMAASSSAGVGAVFIPVELDGDVAGLLLELREAYVKHAGGGIPEIGIKAMGRPFRRAAADGRRWMTLDGIEQLVRDSRAFGLPGQPSSLALTQRSRDLVKGVAELIYKAFPHSGSLEETNGAAAGDTMHFGDDGGFGATATVTSSSPNFAATASGRALPAVGGVDYDVFMDFIRGHMNNTRKKAVWHVFTSLDYDSDGLLCIKDIQASFNAQAHPVVVSDGFFSAEGLLRGFLTLWDENNATGMYGMVPYAEFLDYYNGLSAIIDDDAVFLSIVKTTWKLAPFAQMPVDHAFTRFQGSGKF